MRDTAVVCIKCGSPLDSDSFSNLSISDGRNRIVAILLAFFLGWIGGHKFYLGRIGQGLVYVLFCWTGIPFIVGLIEGAIYLSMSDKAFLAKYH